MNELKQAIDDMQKALQLLSKQKPDAVKVNALLQDARKNLDKAIKSVGGDNQGGGEI